jgi:hypothetical protein
MHLFLKGQAVQPMLKQSNKISSSPINVQAVQTMLKQSNQCSSSPTNAQAVQSKFKQSNKISSSPIKVQAVQSMFKQSNQFSSSPINVRPAQEKFFLICWTLEDKGTTFSRNVGNHSHNDTVSRRRLPECALHASLLSETTAFKHFDILKTKFHSFFKIKIAQRPKQSRQHRSTTELCMV